MMLAMTSSTASGGSSGLVAGAQGYDNPAILSDRLPGAYEYDSRLSCNPHHHASSSSDCCQLDLISEGLQAELKQQEQGCSNSRFIHTRGSRGAGVVHCDPDTISLDEDDEEMNNTEFNSSVLELDSGMLNQVTTYVDIHGAFGGIADSRH